MTRAVVVWITGLPSAGKSTFAAAAFAALRCRQAESCVLDGDAVRESLVPTPDYSPHARANFYETLARLAALLARQGLIVLVPATAHRRVFRERARSLAPSFLEVFIDTPKEECERRDTKGLYAASRTGRAETVPGAGEEFEVPPSADLVAHGGRDAAAVDALCVRLIGPAE